MNYGTICLAKRIMGSFSPSTPLRYPGGKQVLAPFIAEVLRKNEMAGKTYAEPYAGGGGVAMRLLIEGIVSHVILNDKCPLLTTFWRCLLFETEPLVRKIRDTPIDMNEWRLCKHILEAQDCFSPLDVAFSFFFLNRTNFSGIIHGGVIGGKKQTGNFKLDARFPKTRLISLIEQVASFRNHIEIYNNDAVDFLHEVVQPQGKNVFVYCDPPYYIKGKELYLNSYQHNDHEKVANVMTSLTNVPWIVSYDNNDQIKKLYKQHRLFTFDLQYSANEVRKGKELLVMPKHVKLPRDYGFPILVPIA